MPSFGGTEARSIELQPRSPGMRRAACKKMRLFARRGAAGRIGHLALDSQQLEVRVQCMLRAAAAAAHATEERR
jgi:hypothetical protein